jgi:hypothetical protein
MGIVLLSGKRVRVLVPPCYPFLVGFAIGGGAASRQFFTLSRSRNLCMSGADGRRDGGAGKGLDAARPSSRLEGQR